MTLALLNAMDSDQAREALIRCCGSDRWVEAMVRNRPFGEPEELYRAADRIWRELSGADWKVAFAHHPRIGDLDSLKAKYANTRQWAEGEQSGAAGAPEEVLQALAEGNRQYEEKFGYLFIVCATGKSAAEMLEILRSRLPNSPGVELGVAAEEQRKITRLRLEKMITA